MSSAGFLAFRNNVSIKVGDIITKCYPRVVDCYRYHDYDSIIVYIEIHEETITNLKKVSGTICEDTPEFRGYFQNGLPHRQDGPAIMYCGDQLWFKEGKLHRQDGPAKIEANGDYEWYYEGMRHSSLNVPTIKYSNGYTAYYWNDILHREDGPAVIKANGDEFYYYNGILHRSNGPAVKLADGTTKCYINGILHSEGEPTIIIPGRERRWYYLDRLVKIEKIK